MRFHSAVLAIAAGTPYVAIDYTRGGKIAALLRSMGDPARPLKMDSFSGREAAARIIAATKTQPLAPPAGVDAIYKAAWQAVLSQKTH